MVGAQTLGQAESLQAFLAAADEAIASLREKEPALAATDEASDPATAADRRRKHEEAVAELAALAPKVKKVTSTGKGLIDAKVRPRRAGCRGVAIADALGALADPCPLAPRVGHG
jgi:hypothetical protein